MGPCKSTDGIHDTHKHVASSSLLISFQILTPFSQLALNKLFLNVWLPLKKSRKSKSISAACPRWPSSFLWTRRGWSLWGRFLLNQDCWNDPTVLWGGTAGLRWESGKKIKIGRNRCQRWSFKQINRFKRAISRRELPLLRLGSRKLMLKLRMLKRLLIVRLELVRCLMTLLIILDLIQFLNNKE